MTMGVLFYLVHISAVQEIKFFSSFNFLMGDNSVDMIPPTLDNDEPNLTMANQIVYSPTETMLEGYFCAQMVPSSCETNLCSIILCKFAMVLYVHCQQQNPYREGQLYRFKHVLLL